MTMPSGVNALQELLGILPLHRDLKNIAMILFELTTYKINKMILQYKVYVEPDKTLQPLITTHWKVPQMESFEIKREKIFYRSPICEIKCPNCQNKLSLAVKLENRVICLFSSKKSAQCKSPSSRKTSTKLIRNASVLLFPSTSSILFPRCIF